MVKHKDLPVVKENNAKQIQRTITNMLRVNYMHRTKYLVICHKKILI